MGSRIVVLKVCNSRNHFLDTNVILRHANSDSSNSDANIQRILDDAVGPKKSRNLWVSTALFAELRPSNFKPSEKFKTVEDLARYIHSITTVVAIDPYMALRAARLRDCKWLRPLGIRMPAEKPRCMSLGDALHLVSALWVKEATNINDVEFLTFDDGRSRTTEIDPGCEPLSILRLEEYTDGLLENADVLAVANLYRTKPILRQSEMSV
jgi:hypothetical protein